MKTVKGNKLIEMNKNALLTVVNGYKEVLIDLGTGDGRFVYYQAKSTPETLVIGVDPSQKQLEIYSKKAVKEKMENAIFVLGSFELLPVELKGIANIVSITLPWGTLLKAVVKPDFENLSKIKELFASEGNLEIVLGYTTETEPSETLRLELPMIDENYIKKYIFPVFEKNGFIPQKLVLLEKPDLFKIQTTWSKKLSFGVDRPIYLLKFLARNN